MTDDYKAFVRQKRPELASYRTKKSFWENLQDNSGEQQKQPRPSFGDIRRKFNENLAKREAELAKNKDAYRTTKSDGSKITRKTESPVHGPDIKEDTKTSKFHKSLSSGKKHTRSYGIPANEKDALSQKQSNESEVLSWRLSDEKEAMSRRLSRRRSLEKPKAKTFLHMTEVMDGYVPSDTDSVASTKEPVCSMETRTVTGFNKSDNGKDASSRKRTRLRHKNSDTDSNKDRQSSDKMSVDKLETDNKSANINKTQELMTQDNSDEHTKTAIQRQDSRDNPLKRKRDRKSQHLRLSGDFSEITQTPDPPDTPTYDQRSQLTGIQLSTPSNKQPSTPREIQLSTQGNRHLGKTGNISELAGEPSQRSRKDANVITSDNKNIQNRNNNDYVTPDKSNENYSRGNVFTESHTSNVSQIGRDSFKSFQMEYSPPVTSSYVDDDKHFDTIDSTSSEQHRWSTLDSGISVASALQHVKLARTPDTGNASVKPDFLTPPAERRRRIHSSSLSDSDDDSGISWDDLKEFREVPVVVIDKVPDKTAVGNSTSDDIYNVKVEFEHMTDKEQDETFHTISKNDSQINSYQKSPHGRADTETDRFKSASKIGERINKKWKLKLKEDIISDDELDMPLRTSTPTGARVPLVLEPLTSLSNSDVENKAPSHQQQQTISNSEDLATEARSHTTPRQSRLSRFLEQNVNKDSTQTDIMNVKKSIGVDKAILRDKNTLPKLTKPHPHSTGSLSCRMPSPHAVNRSFDNDKVTLRDKTTLPKLTKPRPLSTGSLSYRMSSPDVVREAKSETAPPSAYQVRSHSLTRQQSLLDPMNDVLTKRSPFQLPSSLTTRGTSSHSVVKPKVPYTSQYQASHSHTRTDYNAPGVLYRTRSNPILYEPSVRDTKVTEIDVKPVISARSSVLSRRAKPPPLFSPPPLQPSSLASRLISQQRRSLQHSLDADDLFSLGQTPCTSDDEHSDAGNEKNFQKGEYDHFIYNKSQDGNSYEPFPKRPHASLSTVPSSGVFSDSDNEVTERNIKLLPPSLRLRDKVRSRTSSLSSRPVDLSFSDSECGSEASSRRRRRSRAQSSDMTAHNDFSVQVTSAEVGGKNLKSLQSEHSSQSRNQMSLSKTHRTSAKQIDRESDTEEQDNKDNVRNNAESLKQRKDQNNNMISKQNKALLSLEQLAEEEIISNASKLQIDLFKHKKHFEKDLAQRLESTMEHSDNLVGAIRKSMNQTRTKDKVQEALKHVNEVIKFDIIRDYRAKIQWYKVEINLGSYTHNVNARKTSNFRVTVSCEIIDGPKLSKDIHLDFPASVDLDQLEILQLGNDLQLRVPFVTWNPPKTMDDVIEADGGDPKDTFTRIGFLEKAYKSLGLLWPPEGGTAHYEYFNSKNKELEKEKDNRKIPQPPEYQSLIDSGQLKECVV